MNYVLGHSEAIKKLFETIGIDYTDIVKTDIIFNVNNPVRVITVNTKNDHSYYHIKDKRDDKDLQVTDKISHKIINNLLGTHISGIREFCINIEAGGIVNCYVDCFLQEDNFHKAVHIMHDEFLTAQHRVTFTGNKDFKEKIGTIDSAWKYNKPKNRNFLKPFKRLFGFVGFLVTFLLLSIPAIISFILFGLDKTEDWFDKLTDYFINLMIKT